MKTKTSHSWKAIQTDKYADLKIILLFVFILIGAFLSTY